MVPRLIFSNLHKVVAMRILQSCGSRSWGGLEMQALTAAVELARRGHEVSLLCFPGSTLHKEAATAGVPTVALIANDGNAFRTIKELSRHFRANVYDVIHTHLSHDLWWIVPAMKLASSRASLFLTKHMASGVKKTDPLHTFLYARLQGTFAISNYIRQSVLNTCPVPESRVWVLPPGISPEIFDPALYDRLAARKEFGLNPESIVVGMVGRITPGKGHEEFIRAAARIQEAPQFKYQFVIAGGASVGEEAYALKVYQLARELEVEGAVKFIGFVKEVPRILAALDIMAFPSHEESFGVGLVEAMAMELPVVASGSAGVLDIVVDGETGLLVPAKDYSSFADSISALAIDPEKRRRLGAAARERALNNFSVQSVVTRLEEYYSLSVGAKAIGSR